MLRSVTRAVVLGRRVPCAQTWRRGLRVSFVCALASVGLAESAGAQARIDSSRTGIEIRSRADGVVLVGDLYLPESDVTAEAAVPGIVLLGVTGPNDRSLTLGHLAPFDALAIRLAGEGIAVLSFDDRGVGESGGDWARTGHDVLVEDALSALAVLAAHPRVDAARVGFLGLSEGSGIAMMAAGREPDRVTFLILGSPPGLPGEEALEAQLEASLRLAGIGGGAADLWRAAFDEFVSLARSGDEGALEAFLSGPGAQLIPPYGFVPADAAGRAALFAGPWYRSQLDYRPATFLSRVVAPTLVIGGSLDPILPPELHHPPIKEGIGADDVEQHVFSQLNHLLLPAETGLPAEYARLTESVDPRVPTLIADWLRTRRLLKQ